jgi:predicted alpha/beta superfamily hydrolase
MEAELGLCRRCGEVFGWLHLRQLGRFAPRCGLAGECKPLSVNLHPSSDDYSKGRTMHTGSLRVRLLVSCVFLVACTGARAQLLTPKQDSVYSNVLKQNRAVEVYLPKEFDKDAAQRYETLYVLDGDGNTQIVASIVTFMRESGLVPPVILVTVVANQPRSGGAADFLSFLKTELVPYIDQRYPTDHVHLIHGHSYGGLFLMYTLLHEPALFDGYLILDPSMWWDKHVLDAVIDEKLADVPAKGKAIYIAARSGRAFESMGMSTSNPSSNANRRPSCTGKSRRIPMRATVQSSSRAPTTR